MSAMIDRVLDEMLSRGLNANEADARAIIELLRVPTEAMYLHRPVSVPVRQDWERMWNWQVDAMLKESC